MLHSIYESMKNNEDPTMVCWKVCVARRTRPTKLIASSTTETSNLQSIAWWCRLFMLTSLQVYKETTSNWLHQTPQKQAQLLLTQKIPTHPMRASRNTSAHSNLILCFSTMATPAEERFSTLLHNVTKPNLPPCGKTRAYFATAWQNENVCCHRVAKWRRILAPHGETYCFYFCHRVAK